jgi:hypothetical protein
MWLTVSKIEWKRLGSSVGLHDLKSQVVEFSPHLRRLGASPFPRPHGVAWRAGKEPGRI